MIFSDSEFQHRFFFTAAATALLSLAPAAAAETNSTCRFESIGTARIVAIGDGHILRTADGRTIRLAGIGMPYSGDGRTGPAALASRSTLERLVLEQDVALAAPPDATDRYGRIAAFAFVNGSETPVQYTLLAQGQAWVSARVQEKACAQALLAEERKAREAKWGLWGDPGYWLRAAEDGVALRQQKGRFSVAEGRVVSVRNAGSVIYVNFGKRWSEALTVTILKRNEPAFVAAGIEPRTLEGRIVRIRGYVEMRSGPVIEAIRPQQIEVAAR